MKQLIESIIKKLETHLKLYLECKNNEIQVPEDLCQQWMNFRNKHISAVIGEDTYKKEYRRIPVLFELIRVYTKNTQWGNNIKRLMTKRIAGNDELGDDISGLGSDYVTMYLISVECLISFAFRRENRSKQQALSYYVISYIDKLEKAFLIRCCTMKDPRYYNYVKIQKLLISIANLWSLPAKPGHKILALINTELKNQNSISNRIKNAATKKWLSAEDILFPDLLKRLQYIQHQFNQFGIPDYTKSCNPITKQISHDGRILCMAKFNNGLTFFGDHCGYLHIYSMEDKKLVTKTKEHTTYITKIKAVSEKVVVSCSQNEIILWDCQTFKPTKTFQVPRNDSETAVSDCIVTDQYAIGWSRFSSKILIWNSNYPNKSPRVYQVQKSGYETMVSDVQWYKGNTILCSTTKRHIFTLDLESQKLTPKTLLAKDDSLDFKEDGVRDCTKQFCFFSTQHVLSYEKNGKFTILDYRKNIIVKQGSFNCDVRQFIFSKETANVIVLGQCSSHVKIYNLKLDRVINTLQYKKGVNILSISLDSNGNLYTTHSDGSIGRWPFKKGMLSS